MQGFLHKGAVPHALLFTGSAGIGKRTTARHLAMALNCQATATAIRPCQQCRACHQIAHGNHPDIIEVAPIKGVLRIDQVRRLLSTLAMRPFSAGQRVVILSDAQTLNTEAGNALLKVLEEPPAGTILILTALQRNDLLPTIASRCRHIRFNPLTPEDLAGLLVKEKGWAQDQAMTIAEAAGGSFTKALDLVQAQWQAHRDRLVRAASLDQPDGLKKRSTSMTLAFSALVTLHKGEIDSNLEILSTWIRDLSLLPFAPRQVIHRDRLTTLQKARAGFNDRQLTALWETVEKAQKDIAANGNLRLTLDVMTLRMTAAMAA
ncbi:MAG: DNA polymerase III subunit delta' [Desulfobacteraceae bacterium]|nr:DNA polymerase III subunit delta' [Desulfobacteraceae bacterium]